MTTETSIRSRSEERRQVPQDPRPFGRRAADQVELTDRQAEVLKLVAEGLENKEIATLLGISEQGVKQQVSVLLRKFRAPSRAILARNALTMKLLGSTAHIMDLPIEYLFDRAPLVIAMTRGPQHSFLLVNRAFRELFGDRQYVGRTFRECFPDTGERVFRALATILETGEAYRTNDQRFGFPFPDGTKREAILSLIAEPRRTANDAIDGIVFYAWDITETVRMRRRLQQLTAEQRTLLEQLPVGVIYTDERARPVLVNSVARRILVGAPLDPSRPLYEQFGDRVRYASTGQPLPPADGPSARATAGWPFDEDLVIRTADGLDIPIHVSARPLHDEQGTVTGAALVVTERESGQARDDRGPRAE